MSRISYPEQLRRSYRNWQRKKSRVLPTQVPQPFFHAADIDALDAFFASFTDEVYEPAELPSRLHGSCFVCGREVDFEVEAPLDGGAVNWRETLTCPECHLINRWRGCLHVFEAICQPRADDRIYLTESLSHVHDNLADRFPRLSSSEYLPNAEFGELTFRNEVLIRNEDVTKLGFEDASMDIVLCFDVLEHVPDYRAALRQFHRVLGCGGQLLLSVPFSFQHANIRRAVLDDEGNVQHLLEPCYHGDPLSEQGVLSYHDFGMALLDDLREAGFQECFALCYHSREWGYLHRNVVFIARKLKTSLTKPAIARLAWNGIFNEIRPGTEKLAEFFRSALQYPAKFARRVASRLFAGATPKFHNDERSFALADELRQLPEIHHYWANRYLVPELGRFGFNNTEDFFFNHAKNFLKQAKHRRVNILSIGTWDCDFELRITRRLLLWQLKDFSIECLEVNPEQLAAGRAAVERAGLVGYFRFTLADPNLWEPYRKYDIVFSNQSLHDIWNLEGLFAAVRRSLRSNGLFIVSDMIGRNGTRLWPEAVEALKPWWQELPESYRFNRVTQRQEHEFINRDMTAQGLGSVRSQDILPLLLERFDCMFFFPYGNIIFAFIDRCFGHNFNAEADWDRDFIDRVHARDEAGLLSGELKPAAMLAVFTKRKTDMVLRHPVLTPRHCLRMPGTGSALDADA